MVGYGANKGIVPLACDEIFKRIKANTDPEKSYQVTISQVEIYNEKVQDLAISAEKRNNKDGLQIRDIPSTGP
jgi:hypothetical protein